MHRAFSQILDDHLARYPLMEPRDCVKLAYQSALGPGHGGSGPEGRPPGAAGGVGEHSRRLRRPAAGGHRERPVPPVSGGDG